MLYQRRSKLLIDSLCIAANATNVDGAEKFINFVSDKESALRIADEIGYTTPNKEARKEQQKMLEIILMHICQKK